MNKKAIGLLILPAMLATMPLVGVAEKMPQQQPNMQMQSGQMQAPMMKQLSPQEQETFREWFSKGQWQLVDKNYPEAITLFRQAVELNPANVRAHNQLALAYYFNGEYSPAITEIDRALALDPVNTKLHFTKARILDAANRDAEALESYLTFAALDPQDTSALEAQRRADALFKRWEPKFSESQKLYFTGLRFLSMEQPEKALPLLQSFHKEQPETGGIGSINTSFLMGIAYFQMNRPGEAVAQFEQVTKAEPQNPLAYYHLTETYTRLGKLDNAKTAWEQFVKFAPHSEIGAAHHHGINW